MLRNPEFPTLIQKSFGPEDKGIWPVSGVPVGCPQVGYNEAASGNVVAQELGFFDIASRDTKKGDAAKS